MRFLKFNGIKVQSIKIIFQNIFGIEKILKIEGATSILMRGRGENLIDLLVNRWSILHLTSHKN